MKRQTGRIMSVMMIAMLIMLTGCAKEVKSPEVINAAVLKGPTAIGMVNLMDKNDAGTSSLKYDFKIAGTADEITGALIKGDIQAAAIPANLASVLYNKSNGGIKVAAVNNLGVLYIVERGETISSVEDLKGKTICTTGAGTTPEYTLRYLIKSAGMDPDRDVNIVFKSEASEVAALLAAGEETIAMLPQPYVTVAQTQTEGLRIALDINEEWERYVGDGSQVVTGVIVVNTGFAEEYPDAAAKFIEEYAASAKKAVEDVEGTAALVGKYDIFKEAVAKKAIPMCNIVSLQGDDMKKAVNGYLKVLYDMNPASVGGALPGDDFWFE